ncbi:MULTISPECIES: spore coat U domain-containing protein [unclassified Rhizobium]|jgi:spore coat protein U-like protein|uniref:Csu type fimbrial protein n=1 Tax=unclassified Rhizobium TaxID=2613769 RepID=UPI0006481E42|nr:MULTISPECIES: spore coat U domain-containing protein [unclassified Rhizobium]MBN8952933.1 spore coat U domain-containing protein [Rhizobium tropici]OJY76551.1 MAG: spore coat protein u [Rhizobium sp. 60-20]RKD52658.1 spore coat protein U-like protein [Rhizobium sp. WW_1]
MLRSITLLLILLLPSICAAQSCNFSATDMNFGAVDTLSGTPVNMTSTISVTCSGGLLDLGKRLLICPNIGAGSGGASSSAARQMLNGTSSLDYQLYSDTGRSVVWGSSSWPYASRAPVYALTMSLLNGSLIGATGSMTIYGAALGTPSTAVPGAFTSSFTSTYNAFYYVYSSATNCTAPTGTIGTASFNVNASVAANCLVSVQNINFGTQGVLSANVDATGSVTATCSPGTTYTISLNGGTSNAAPTARQMKMGTQAVTYGLYKDTNRSQPWGDVNTPGSTVAGTGTGTGQLLTVYGRVPPQTTPAPGVYTDTVVVTLTF